jgi:uncharacterized protein (DUF433 family)
MPLMIGAPRRTRYTVSFVCYPALMASRSEQSRRKGEPFSVRFTASTDRSVAEEARRTRRSKSAVVEALTEEAVQTRRFPGIAFRGDDARRRPWVIGTGLDIWEIVQMIEDYGSIERLVEDAELSDRQVRLALAYRDAYPHEIADAIGENRRSAAEWHQLYPFIEFVAPA